jgi:hypothetical protein
MAFTTNGLEMRGKLTVSETAETERFLRSGLSWVRLGVRSIYLGFFIVMLAWLMIASAMRGQFVNTFRNFLPLLLVILFGVAMVIYRQRRARARAGRSYNAGAPDRFRLTSTELSWESASGAKGSAPWTTYRGWREGKSVIFLLCQDKSRAVILPKADASPMELEMVRGMLTAALGPATKK